jgi:epsin
MAAKWLADQARKTFQPTEVEEKLKEALSKKNYGTAKSILNEIARYTFDYSQYNVVMEAVWKAINQKGKNWRVVFKGLELMDHLIKNGAERVVDECRERIYTIRTLTEFQYHEDRKDKGAGVRQMAKTVVAMLNDTDMIRTERAKARKLRDRFVGISNTGNRTLTGGRDDSNTNRGNSNSSNSSSSDNYNSRGADGGYRDRKSVV